MAVHGTVDALHHNMHRPTALQPAASRKQPMLSKHSCSGLLVGFADVFFITLGVLA